MNPKPGGRKKPERVDAAGDVEKLWLVLRKRLILPGEAAPACPVSSYVAMLNARKSCHHPQSCSCLSRVDPCHLCLNKKLITSHV